MCFVCVYMTALTSTLLLYFLFTKQNAVYKLYIVHNVTLSYEQLFKIPFKTKRTLTAYWKKQKTLFFAYFFR